MALVFINAANYEITNGDESSTDVIQLKYPDFEGNADTPVDADGWFSFDVSGAGAFAAAFEPDVAGYEIEFRLNSQTYGILTTNQTTTANSMLTGEGFTTPPTLSFTNTAPLVSIKVTAAGDDLSTSPQEQTFSTNGTFGVNLEHDGTPGGSVTFTFEAIVEDLTQVGDFDYQWTNVTTGTPLTGETNDTLGPVTFPINLVDTTTLSVTVTDSGGLSTTRQVGITANEPNAAPEIQSTDVVCSNGYPGADVYCVVGDGGYIDVTITPGATDVAGDTLTHSWTDNFGGGVEVSTSDILELTDLEAGLYSYEYTVTDSYGATDTQNYTFTVRSQSYITYCSDSLATNYEEVGGNNIIVDNGTCDYGASPVITFDSSTEMAVNENSNDNMILFSFSDDSGEDCNEYAVASSSSDAYLTNFVFTPVGSLTQPCEYSLTFDALDVPSDYTATTSVTITITDVNGNSTEGVVSVSITDVDVYGCTDGTALNPNGDATEDDGSCVYAHTITDVESTISINELETYCEQFSVANPNSADDFTLSVESNNDNCTVSGITQGACNGSASGASIHHFNITANEINSDTDFCDITVTATNDTEVGYEPWSQTSEVTINSIIGDIIGVGFNINEDSQQYIDLSDYVSGNDGDSLSYYIVSLPPNGELFASGAAISTGELGTSELTYHPGVNFNGTDSFTWYIVDVDDDPTGLYTGANFPATITINVGAINDAPEITDETIAALNAISHIQEDGNLTISVSATDVDGDEITWTGASTNLVLSFDPITSNTSNLMIVPASNWCGTENITITASDASDGAAMDSHSFDVVVDCVEHFPEFTLPPDITISESSYDGQYSEFYIITITDDDPDNVVFFVDVTVPDGLIINSHQSDFTQTVPSLEINEFGQAYAQVPIVTKSIAYWNGEADVSISVTDETGNTTEGSYHVIVDGVDNPPSFLDIGSLTVDEDSSNNQFTIYIY